ncbi:MAG: hypothetical protein ACXVYY_01310 [Oryzihumus sp.]
MVQSRVQDERMARRLAQRARSPIEPRPAEELTGTRGRYEACFTEIQRLLSLLKADSIPEKEMRALTVRMGKLQAELRGLRSAVDDLCLLGDQVVEAVLRHTS